MHISTFFTEALVSDTTLGNSGKLLLFFTLQNLKKSRERSSSVTRAPSIDQTSGGVSDAATTPDDDCDILPSVGLDRFYDWVKTEPAMLGWLPAMHRLVIGEKLVHQVRCTICQNFPMKGLRWANLFLEVTQDARNYQSVNLSRSNSRHTV